MYTSKSYIFSTILKFNFLQGLSLSGCESAVFCKTFEDKLKEYYPDLTHEVIVVSDTLAPIALACESGIYKIIYFLYYIN